MCDSGLWSSQKQNQTLTFGNTAWIPQNGYLLAYCRSGQTTNQLLCIQRAIIIAGLLNRTVLINDNAKEAWANVDYHTSIDFIHIDRCFGKGRVMTRTQYKKELQKDIEIDEILCWTPWACLSFVKSVPSLLPSYYSGWPSIHVKKGTVGKKSNFHASEVTQAQLLAELGNSTGEVLTVGEMFRLEVKEYSENNSFYIPFKRDKGCSNPLSIIPSKRVMQAAAIFVNETFLGKPFIGVHWRRGDFDKYCNNQIKDKRCFRPTRTVAYCIAEKAMLNGIKKIYVATNAKSVEIAQLTRMVAALDPSISLAFFSKYKRTFPRLFKRLNLTSSGSHIIPFEKAMCVLSSVFLANRHSTFSKDIERMRYGFRTATCRDTYICGGITI